MDPVEDVAEQALAACRALVGVAARSLGAALEEMTLPGGPRGPGGAR
jgi:hypothetical protein